MNSKIGPLQFNNYKGVNIKPGTPNKKQSLGEQGLLFATKSESHNTLNTKLCGGNYSHLNELSSKIKTVTSDKEKNFEMILDSAQLYFNKPESSAAGWIDYCLKIRANKEPNKLSDLRIYQAAHNENSLWVKVLPRQFQKSLAIGYILEQGANAFDVEHKFDFKKFKLFLQNENVDNYTFLAKHLDVEYFKHICYDAKTSLVKFGNTHYKNEIKLPQALNRDDYPLLSMSIEQSSIDSMLIFQPFIYQTETHELVISNKRDLIPKYVATHRIIFSPYIQANEEKGLYNYYISTGKNSNMENTVLPFLSLGNLKLNKPSLADYLYDTRPDIKTLECLLSIFPGELLKLYSGTGQGCSDEISFSDASIEEALTDYGYNGENTYLDKLTFLCDKSKPIRCALAGFARFANIDSLVLSAVYGLQDTKNNFWNNPNNSNFVDYVKKTYATKIESYTINCKISQQTHLIELGDYKTRIADGESMYDLLNSKEQYFVISTEIEPLPIFEQKVP